MLRLKVCYGYLGYNMKLKNFMVKFNRITYAALAATIIIVLFEWAVGYFNLMN